MATVIKTVSFTNSNQQLTWTAGYTVEVTAYLWGAGGGGGGNDRLRGGFGSGGGFSEVSFFLDPGETLTVSVGGPGRAGVTSPGIGGAAGGSQGPSYFTTFNGYSGGSGSAAGPAPWSGGGAGGGGATVLLKNDGIIAVAGGGGGGGGGGNASAGQDAPGNYGHRSVTGGGDGVPKGGDGGGAGGGGGGNTGGNGGPVFSGDSGGGAGNFGTSLGSVTVNPTDRNAANRVSEFYVGSVGSGGVNTSAGSAGYAVFAFNIAGTYVNDGFGFKPVNQVYVNQNGNWLPVRRTWINQNGIWKPTDGSFAPDFFTVPGNYGNPVKICIGVADENSATPQSTMNSNWDTFLTRFPGSQLYCLQPGGPSRGSLRVPPNFVSSGQGFGPIPVSRDDGDVERRDDWFEICNLGSRPPGSVVEYSIDNSGSMTTATVQASVNLFLTKCAQAGLTVRQKTMTNENWIAPFI
jgi:hypothetical protein